MFTGFTPRTLDFIWELRFNNNREWFTAHKEEFQQVFQSPMKALADQVFAEIQEVAADKALRHKVSRIYRDARRVKGGEPYRDNLWFSIERPSEEWTATPVFWFELSPEGWSYGLGYYQAKAGTMARFRARLEQHPEKLEVLARAALKSGEFVLDGPEYARKKPAPTPGTEPWYNRKSVSIIHTQDNGPELFEESLADRITAGFKSLLPLYDYLASLDSDPEPRA